MVLSLSTYSITREYSDNEEDNYFDITATVSGVKSKDVDTSVDFVVSNSEIVSPVSDAQVSGSSTTKRFKINDTGRVTIKVSTLEGGNSGVKTKTVDVNITRDVDGLELTYADMPIIRGVATDITSSLYDGSYFVKFTPSNTTNRDLTIKALDSNTGEELAEGVTIDGNKITVTDDVLNEFTLQVSSADNDEVLPVLANVKVLEKVIADDFVVRATNEADVQDDVQKIYVDRTLMYNLSLSNADSDDNSNFSKVLEVYNDELNLSDASSPYTLRARNMNKTQTNISGLDYVAVRKNMSGSFTLGEGRGEGSDIITLLVYYKGYENIYSPVEIPVNIQVGSYPSILSFVRSMSTFDAVDNIPVYQNTNYYNGKIGSSVYLQIRNTYSTGTLQQYAYVYVADATSHERVDNGIRIYHYVGGNLERVYATTPVRNGEQLFINYTTQKLLLVVTNWLLAV